MQILFFSERAGTEHHRVRRLPERHVEEVHARALSRRRRLRQSRHRSCRRAAAAAAAAPAAPAADAAARGGGSAPVLLSADGSSVFFQGTPTTRTRTRSRRRASSTRSRSRPARSSGSTRATTTASLERVSTIVDRRREEVHRQRESPTEVPQNFLLDGGRRVQLTKNVDRARGPDPREGRALRRRAPRRLQVPRQGDAAARLSRPARGCRRSSGSTRASSRRRRTTTAPIARSTRTSFTNFGTRSMEYFVRLGYAVVDPDTPIVGPQGQMNNNYVNDLRNDLAATIDELDRRQLVDRQRLAIGGHSYGAFSTVNAMVHTPFFKAGIAGDGAYNRTLTPLGFQSERRDLWEAPNVYLGHVAVPLRQQPDRRAADVSQPRRSERRHRSDQLDPPLPRAQRARARRRRSICIRSRITGRSRRKRCSICGRAGARGSTST